MKRLLTGIVFPLIMPFVLSAQWLETTIPVGQWPYDLVYNSTHNKIYCSITSSGEITVIDGATNEIITSLPLYSQPTTMAYNVILDKVYCITSDDRVAVIDGNADTLIKRVPVGTGTFILIHNPANNRVYCGSWQGGTQNDRITVIDCVTDSVVKIIDFGLSNHPIAMVCNRAGNKLYCGNWGQGTVKVIDCSADTLIATIPVGHHPRVLIYNHICDKVYCANTDPMFYEESTITVIDGIADTVIKEIPFGYMKTPLSLGFNGINNKIYCGVIDQDIRIIDCIYDTVISRFTIGYSSKFIYNCINNKIYASISNPPSVVVIDGATNEIITSIAVDSFPCAFAWNPVQNRIYVANDMDATISVIRDIVGVEEKSTMGLLYLPFEIFPNPAKDFVCLRHIRREAEMQGNRGEVKIYDVVGRLVQNENWENVENIRQIALKNLSAGVYFIKLQAENTNFIRKFIVTK